MDNNMKNLYISLVFAFLILLFAPTVQSQSFLDARVKYGTTVPLTCLGTRFDSVFIVGIGTNAGVYACIGGTYVNTSQTAAAVTKLATETIPLNDLSDVALFTPASGQYLKFNGTNWLNSFIVKQDVGLSNVDNTTDIGKPISTAAQNLFNLKADLIAGKVPVEQLPATATGATTLAGLTDVAIVTPANTQYLKFNGTKWINSVIATSEVNGLDNALNSKLNTSDFAANFSSRLSFSPIDGLNDVDTGLAVDGQVLKRVGGVWKGAAETGGTIADGSITTAKLADKAATFAKFQDVSASKLLGRAATIGGSMQEITLGTNLTFNATTSVLNATGGSGGSLSTLTDVSIPTAPVNGQVLKHNGTVWTTGTDVSTTGTGSTTVSLAGNYSGNLLTAVSTIGTVNLTVLTVDAPATLTDVVIIPANIKLDFQQTGKITKGANATAGTAGKIVCQGMCFNPPNDPYQLIFEGFGVGDIEFGLSQIFPLASELVKASSTTISVPNKYFTNPSNQAIYNGWSASLLPNGTGFLYQGKIAAVGGVDSAAIGRRLITVDFIMQDIHTFNANTIFQVIPPEIPVKMPSEISPIWFGGIVSNFNANGATPTANTSTIAAVNTIMGAFTGKRQTNRNYGTVIKFPAGDYWLDNSIFVSKNFSLKGVENSSFGSRASRLFFKNGRSGIVFKPNANGDTPEGNLVQDLEIRQDVASYYDALVTIGGTNGLVMTAATTGATDFGDPFNDGDTVTVRNSNGSNYSLVGTKRKFSTSPTGTAGSAVINIAAVNTFPPFKNTYDQTDVNSEFMLLKGNSSVKYKIASVQTATQITLDRPLTNNVNLDSASSGYGAFVSSAKVIDIKKFDFIAGLTKTTAGQTALQYACSPATSTQLHSPDLFVGQSITFQSRTIETRTIRAYDVNNPNCLMIDPLPAGFTTQDYQYVYAEIQGLNAITTPIQATVNRYAGIDIIGGSHIKVDNVRVQEFKGDGVRVDTDQYQHVFSDTANFTSLNNLHVDNNASNGLHFEGSDSNAGIVTNFFAILNGGYGIYDNSYLGNTYNAGEISDNRNGTVFTKKDSTNESIFTGLYTEAGVTGMNLGKGNIFLGGNNGTGFHRDSQHNHGFANDVNGSLVTGRGFMFRDTLGNMSMKLIATSYQNRSYFLAAGGQKYTDAESGGGAGSGASQTANSLSGQWDWAMGNGELGHYGYIGRTIESVGDSWTLAWDAIARVVLVRTLRIGGGSTDINTSNYTQMISGIAAPTTGSHAKGAIVWNRTPVSGGTAGWINIGDATTANWQTFATISGTATTTTTTTTTSGTILNYALTSNSGTIADNGNGCSNISNSVIDGIKHTSGAYGCTTAYTSSAVVSATAPAIVTATLSQSRSISKINLYGLGDLANYSVEPTATETSRYANQDFKIEYSTDGTTWTTAQTVTSNALTLNSYSFATPFTASRIRLTVTRAAGGQAYLTEFEVFGS